MVQKKPPGVSWESFVERQIREAQEAGAFDNLPGFGKPIADLDRPDDDLWWIKEWLKRENLSVLPPSLEILRTIEKELEAICLLPRESDVRRAVAKLNDKIRSANFAITSGPASTASLLDVEDVVSRWQSRQDSRHGCSNGSRCP